MASITLPAITAVAVGGAMGAVARHTISTWVTNWQSQYNSGLLSMLPLGTLLINVSGSLFIGILYVILTERVPVAPQLRGVLMIGFLGAFTTFSTYSLDSLLLLERGLWLQAAIYIAGSVIFCLMATWLGMVLTRALT